MKNIQIIFAFLAVSLLTFGQDYAPAAGQDGSTAISYDNPSFVNWATGIELTRGYINIENPEAMYDGSHFASFGEPEDALGPVTNNSTDVVSLGDSGVAILTFQHPITNGPGFDFAVFENGITDNFLELAHVEVSSDGINFVRFPSHSKTQTDTQVGGFDFLDPVNLNNLAGKYKVGYGTPFDLEELKDHPDLDVEKITHVKIIDVVGTLGEKGTVDSFGNKINDPFPTPFASGGFDLSGVGVINERNSLGIAVDNTDLSIYPNPSKGKVTIHMNNANLEEITIYSNIGEVVENLVNTQQINFMEVSLHPGMYLIHVKSQDRILQRKIIIH